MPKIMIMSLGGSPEPLSNSIAYHKPETVLFLTSHDSIAKAAEVLRVIDFKPQAYFEITENPNLMFECYKAARKCVDRVKKANVQPNDVIVDYTGGTKVMTAALILATIGHRFKFNYVGGDQRNKNGLGTVTDGYETMFAEMSPWAIFAEEERRQVITLFNRRRFSAVIEIIDSCPAELPGEIKKYFGFVRSLAEGFLSWEQFNHAGALKKINDGFTGLSEYLSDKYSSELKQFSLDIARLLDFLKLLLSNTRNLKVLDMILVEDLINNARRRMKDKRYDDAAARIYRALELFGQICFQQLTGSSNDRVNPEILPEEIRDEFIRKYCDRENRFLKLPMSATYEFLKVKGHEAGIRFFQRKKEIKNIQSNRNLSILAHGIEPVTERAIQSIFDTVSDFIEIKYIFDFPSLP